jgi:hypothetical protein
MAFLRLEYLSNARLIYLLLNFIKIYVEIIEKVRPKSLVGGLLCFFNFFIIRNRIRRTNSYYD